MSQADPPKRKPGRPPSAEARERALAVAHEILMAEGFGRLSIEAVAARSGVGKPTLYRNWAKAQELALAALVANPLPEAQAEGVTARARLSAQMRGLVTAFATTRGRQVALALASADPESEFTKAFRNKVILASREKGRTILESAIASGEIASPPDLQVLLDMIYGPVFYRLLVGHQPLDPAFAEAIVETVFRAGASPPPSDASAGPR
jgi:AcrR family transcriptional regulator